MRLTSFEMPSSAYIKLKETKYQQKMNKFGLSALLLAVVVSSCASSPSLAEWPKVVVPIEAVQPLKPMTLSLAYKLWDGKPTGTTVLRVHVDKDGSPRKVGVLEASGHSNIDEAAINSAWKAKYRPYIQDGVPIDVTAVVPMRLK